MSDEYTTRLPMPSGSQVDRGGEAADRTIAEIAHLDDAAVFLPLAVAVLPAQPQRAQAHTGEAVDAAVRVGALLDPVDRRAG